MYKGTIDKKDGMNFVRDTILAHTLAEMIILLGIDMDILLEEKYIYEIIEYGECMVHEPKMAFKVERVR